MVRAGSKRQRRFAELALVGNTIVWGATFTLVKSALGGVSAILFLALRFSLATVVLALIFRKLIHLSQAIEPSAGLWKNAAPGSAGGPLSFLGLSFSNPGPALHLGPEVRVPDRTNVCFGAFARFVRLWD